MLAVAMLAVAMLAVAAVFPALFLGERPASGVPEFSRAQSLRRGVVRNV